MTAATPAPDGTSASFDAVRAALVAAGVDDLLGASFDAFTALVLARVESRVGSALLARTTRERAVAIVALWDAGRDDEAELELTKAVPDHAVITSELVDAVVRDAVRSARAITLTP